MERMKLVSRGFAVTFIVTVVVGCAAGQQASPNPGSGGTTSGAAGSTGVAGSTGAAGSACVTPPVVQVSWQLMTGVDLSSPKLTCAQAGAKYVEFFMDTSHTQFDCTAGQGMTTAFPPGMYTPRILLTDNSDQIVFNQPVNKTVIVPTCGTTNIGNYALVVQQTGAAGAGGSTGAAGSSGSAGSTGSAGSGGKGGSSGAAGSTGAGGAGGTGPCNASSIFAMHSCAFAGACHDANGTSAGFNMASVGWEKNLVGKFPKGGGAMGFGSMCGSVNKAYLVAGSSPATGLFMDKLKRSPPCGSEMPLLTSYLTDAELACIQTWANALTKP
jgi:hypothetical protein